MSATSTWQVVGMTCEHCVRAVREEVGGIDGVSDVRVDLASGQVSVTSAAPLAEEQVAGAVDEAGYRLG